MPSKIAGRRHTAIHPLAAHAEADDAEVGREGQLGAVTLGNGRRSHRPRPWRVTWAGAPSRRAEQRASPSKGPGIRVAAPSRAVWRSRARRSRRIEAECRGYTVASQPLRPWVRGDRIGETSGGCPAGVLNPGCWEGPLRGAGSILKVHRPRERPTRWHGTIGDMPISKRLFDYAMRESVPSACAPAWSLPVAVMRRWAGCGLGEAPRERHPDERSLSHVPIECRPRAHTAGLDDAEKEASMSQRRQVLVNQFEQASQEMIATVERCSDAQWTTKTSSEAWSVGVVAHHVAQGHGISADEARGRGWQAAVHPEDRPKLIDRWAEIVASGHGGEFEGRLRRHDGAFRWVVVGSSRSATTRVRSSDGTVSAPTSTPSSRPKRSCVRTNAPCAGSPTLSCNTS